MATIRVARSATINAPATTVYRLLADYRKGHPSVLPRSITITHIDKGGYGAGTVVRVRSRMAGQTRLARFRVTEPEPGRVLVESEPETGTVTTFTVDPDGDGQSRVEIATAYEGRGGPLGRVEQSVARLMLGRVYRQQLKNIAKVAGATT